MQDTQQKEGENSHTSSTEHNAETIDKSELRPSTCSDPEIPDIAWYVNGDHDFDDQWKTFKPTRSLTTVKQMRPYFRSAFRVAQKTANYALINMKNAQRKKEMFPSTPFEQIYGVPMGGIGCGSIGRSFYGDFLERQLSPTVKDGREYPGSMFILTIRHDSKPLCQYMLGSERSSSASLGLQSFVAIPQEKIHYYGLFPQSWTVYDLVEDYGIKLICRQVSPVIAHNYQDSSMPCCAFNWTAINMSETEHLDVSLTFCWQARMEKELVASSCQSFENANCKGVWTGGNLNELPLSFSIAAGVNMKDDAGSISVRQDICSFSMLSCRDLWNNLNAYGKLTGPGNNEEESTIADMMAICKKVQIEPGERKLVRMALAWHMPLIKFGGSTDEQYTRYYTKYFDGDDKSAVKLIAEYALVECDRWIEKIERWQSGISENSDHKRWTKCALINELYYLVSGGSVWIMAEHAEHTHVRIWGRFGILEGREYPMYNTYDVMFYASTALVQLWPNLQLSTQYDFAAVIPKADMTKRKYLFTKPNFSKLENRVPHDIGGPGKHPWVKYNTFGHADTNNWKDLNLKFILVSYRDFYITQDLDYLKTMYTAIQLLIPHIESQDTNKDGIVDNKYFDQTFDAWEMNGCSAYCGGLQIAALRCLIEIEKHVAANGAGLVGHHRLSQWLHSACVSYDLTLWNDIYYKLDSSQDIVMAAQLSGYWYLKQCGISVGGDDYPELARVFSKERIASILNCLIKYNHGLFMNGLTGIVNGTRLVSEETGWQVDRTSVQAEECWIGIVFSIVSLMNVEGMKVEADKLVERMIEWLYNVVGTAYQTPEAFNGRKRLRGLCYMRPLSIWSIHWLLIQEQQKKARDSATKLMSRRSGSESSADVKKLDSADGENL